MPSMRSYAVSVSMAITGFRTFSGSQISMSTVDIALSSGLQVVTSGCFRKLIFSKSSCPIDDSLSFVSRISDSADRHM